MAETDGTPRFRKSKPPKGANGPDARGARNGRPSAKAKKSAALRDTLPSGSAVDMDIDTDAESDPTAARPPTANSPDLPNSVVKTAMPTVIRPDGAANPGAETTSTRSTNARSTAPLAGGTPGPQPRTIRSALGSTLRMELTVHPGEGSEPRVQVRSTAPLGTAGLSDPAPSKSGHASDDAASLRDNFMRSRKSTTQGFAPASPDPSARPARHHTSGVGTDPGAHARAHEPLRRGGDFETGFGAQPPLSSSTGNSNRPRRPRRPGERTLIMTRRPKGSKRDWVFVVLLVAALGLTASMFLSQQTPAEEVVDASAYDDEIQEQYEEAEDPFAPTTLKHWTERDRERAKNAPELRQSDTNALTAHEPSVAANSIQATELRSQPPGAEVIAGNAVVGSTPVRVARGSADMVYLLRLAGHESKIVRVGPHSPATIVVELGPLTPPTNPADGTANVPAAASGSLPVR